MKISFKAPGGEILSFTAPDDATPELLQDTINSVAKQYMEHYSPSQMRLKTGKPLVTSEPEVKRPGFLEEMKSEAQAGLKDITDVGLVDPTNPANIGKVASSVGGALRVANAPVTAAGDVAGGAALDATGSPALATLANVGVQGLALESPNLARRGLGAAARLGKAPEAVKVATEAAEAQSTADIGAAALGAEHEVAGGEAAAVKQSWDELIKERDKVATPEVVTKEGKKGRVRKDLPGGKVEIATDDGAITIEDAKKVSLWARPTQESVQQQIDALMAKEPKAPPATIKLQPRAAQMRAEEDEFSRLLSRDELEAQVNAQKPPRSEALHATEATDVGLRPAIREGGKVYAGEVGEVHNDILSKMPEGKKLQAQIAAGRVSEAQTHGYVDANNQFMTRSEATAKVGTSKDVKEAAAKKLTTIGDPATAAIARAQPVTAKPPTPLQPSPTELLNREAAKRTAKLAGSKPPPAEVDIGWPTEGLKYKSKAELEQATRDVEAPQMLSTLKALQYADPNVKLDKLAIEDRRYIDKFKAHIRQHGIEPIEIGMTDAGRPIIEDGHHRLVAARELGIDKVPVKYVKKQVPTATQEVQVVLPEIQKTSRKAVRNSLGKDRAIDPSRVEIGMKVDTTKGTGVVEQLDVSPEGELISSVRLDNGQMHKTPYVFKLAKSEAGTFDPLLVPRFAKALATSAVQSAEKFSKVWVRPLFSPATVSDKAEMAGMSLRQRLSEMNADHDVTAHHMQALDSFFNQFTNAEKVQIWQRMQHGLPQQGPFAAELDKIATSFRQMLVRRERAYSHFGRGLALSPSSIAALFKDADRAGQFANLATLPSKALRVRAAQLKKLPGTAQQAFFSTMMAGAKHPTPELQVIDDQMMGKFFRGFKNPQNAQRTFDRLYGANGVAGTKKAHYNFFAEGLMAELEPVSFDPHRLMASRMYQMDKGIMRDRVIEDMLPELSLVRKGEEKVLPANMVRLKYYDELSKYEASKFGVRGPAIWYAPEDVARLINNHLAPGLRGHAGKAGKAYDFGRDTTMLMTMSRLGMSAFHATDIAMVSPIVKIGDAWVELINNRSMRGFKDLSLIPGKGVYQDYMRGAALRKEYLEKWGSGQPMDKMIEQLIQAGHKMGHDVDYATQYIKAFKEALHSQSYGKAAKYAYPAIMEAVAKPLFEHLVPNLSTAAAARRIQNGLAAMPPGSSVAEIAKMAARVVDETHNVFGLVNYDNYHLHRAFKDGLFVTFQAPGWFLGSLRQMKGAAFETGQMIADMSGGRWPKIGPKQGFWLGVATVHPIANTLMQYALTGTFPEFIPNDPVQTFKNFMTHKTGRTLPNGKPEIAMLPGYHRELAHIFSSVSKGGPLGFFEYLGSKVSGPVQDVWRQYQNRDYFGTQISEPAAMTDVKGVAKNIGQRLKYEAKSSLPISAQSIMSSKVSGAGKYSTAQNVLGSLLGSTNAPAYLTRSRLANFFFDQKPPTMGRTVEQGRRANERYDLMGELRGAKGEDRRKIMDKISKDETLNQSDKARVVRDASKSDIQLMTEHVGPEVMLKGMEYATPEERRELLPLIIDKLNRSRNLSAQQQQQLRQQLMQYMPQRSQNAPTR